MPDANSLTFATGFRSDGSSCLDCQGPWRGLRWLPRPSAHATLLSNEIRRRLDDRIFGHGRTEGPRFTFYPGRDNH